MRQRLERINLAARLGEDVQAIDNDGAFESAAGAFAAILDSALAALTARRPAARREVRTHGSWLECIQLLQKS